MITKEKKVLWASRHPLDPEAEKTLRAIWPEANIEAREIIWPSGREECLALARELGREYNILAGVWPAQALEAFVHQRIPVFSPVSVPVQETDGSKTRAFRFVRWARIA